MVSNICKCSLIVCSSSLDSVLIGEQGERSGENTRFVPMWPGFDAWTRGRTWVEFVVGFRP